jgi:hypothetical protein
MGVSLFIEREDDPISWKEWIALVRSERKEWRIAKTHELVDQESAPELAAPKGTRFTFWVGERAFPRGVGMIWSGGSVEVSGWAIARLNASDPVFAKMQELARRLEARIVDDDGERVFPPAPKKSRAPLARAKKAKKSPKTAKTAMRAPERTERHALGRFSFDVPASWRRKGGRKAKELAFEIEGDRRSSVAARLGKVADPLLHLEARTQRVSFCLGPNSRSRPSREIRAVAHVCYPTGGITRSITILSTETESLELALETRIPWGRKSDVDRAYKTLVGSVRAPAK